jgi:5-methylcytosine-specific restriction enzyme A
MRRSSAAQSYRRLYATGRWKTLRAAYLAANPWCAFCAQRGDRIRATVVDHRDRHGGDEAKFWAGPFDGLCDVCHSSAKQRAERRGFSCAIGADGWPISSDHPANSGRLPGPRGRTGSFVPLPLGNPSGDFSSQKVPKKGLR